MADEEHRRLLKQGAAVWNEWREAHPLVLPHLSQANLREANLREANLRGADLFGANLNEADLRGADLSEADLSEANFIGAKLVRADLSEAILFTANLSGANLSRANLSRADLQRTLLLNTVLNEADLTASRVYGVSVWGISLEGAKQTNLIIAPADEPAITVDNLEVAQFIYLLLNNEKIRDVINTITTKAVLILGCFWPERKTVLDAIRDKLRTKDYLPILFDFDPAATRDLTETVTTLAQLSRFIIADLTDPRSIPQELASIVPDLPSVPVAPLLAASGTEYGMFEHFRRYPWVLGIHRYRDLDDLLASLQDQVIAPAEAKAKELQQGHERT